MSEKSVNKTNFRNVDATFYQYDPTFGFWGIPNVEMDFSFKLRPNVYIHCRHNAKGNRDKTFEAEKIKNPILCLGGSHSWGVGVEQELRYSDVLEKMTGTPVLNLGHCSLGLDQICLVILKKADYYKPSIIIVEQYPWAIHRILSPYVIGYTRPYFYLDSRGNLKLQKVPTLSRFKVCRRIVGSFYTYQKEFKEFQAGIDLKEDYDPWTDPIFLYWKVPYYDYMYNLTDKILSVMQDFCRRKGIRLLFGLGAIMQQFGQKRPSALVDYDLPRKRLIASIEKNGITFVDTTAPMLAAHTAKDPVIFPDGHMNEKGHRIFACEVAKILEKRKWMN